MTASRKRLKRSPKLVSKEAVMRTWPLTIRQERAKERVPTRRVTVGATSQSRKKKDLIKVKCFACHKSGHYASQCSKKKKGKGKSQQVAASAENQLKEFTAKFESDFSLVSCLSTSTVSKSAWYLDSHASRHMTEALELLSNLTETNSGIHVELGDDVEYAMKGDGTVLF
jgi:hypothetical protein